MINKQELIKELITIDGISINFEQPYLWSSGTSSPVYVDNRLIISYPLLRTNIITALANIIKTNFVIKKPDIIFGTATAGIAFASLISDVLSLPCGYVRSSNKKYGKQKIIEGFYQPDMCAVVIEDTVSTGTSVLNTVKILEAAGIKVLAVLTIFNYNFTITQISFLKAGIKLYSLLNFQDLIDYNNFNNNLKNRLNNFYDQINESRG